MKILKRNQLIILVVSLMLITAGYLNFTANQENIVTSVIADRSDEAIGDAELVSTIPKDNEKETIENLLNNEQVKNEQDNENELSNIQNNKESTETSNNPEDYYFTTSKLERNTMYSENLETYQEMYNNSNATAEQKNAALSKINDINNIKNSIMIAENLIVAKGFKDVVIFVNEGSVSVIIKAEELNEEQVAQIQNIVSREINVEAEIIHISNK